MNRKTSARTLTPIDLFQRFLAQRAAVEAGNTSERYHLHATARIINRTFNFDPALTLDELEAWCRTALGMEQRS
jgi:hypothetical protein